MTPADGASLALLLAFAVAAYGAMASVLGARRGLPELTASARNGALVVAGLLTLAALALVHALLTHDFSLRYVYDHSSRAMSPAALVTSFWGGQQGSLLLWAWGSSCSSWASWRAPSSSCPSSRRTGAA
jgi:cytochrome c-type biogenesis protein CcmF